MFNRRKCLLVGRWKWDTHTETLQKWKTAVFSTDLNHKKYIFSSSVRIKVPFSMRCCVDWKTNEVKISHVKHLVIIPTALCTSNYLGVAIENWEVLVVDFDKSDTDMYMHENLKTVEPADECLQRQFIYSNVRQQLLAKPTLTSAWHTPHSCKPCQWNMTHLGPLN